MTSTIGGGAALTQAEAQSPLQRRLAFIVILASALGTGLIFTAVVPILPILAANFGPAHGEQLAQMAVTTPSLGMVLGGAVAGWLLAMTGKRALILVTILAMGVFGAVGGLLTDPWLFLASRLALGVACVMFGTACMTLLADLYEGEARAGAMSVVQAVGAFGSVPCVLAAGALARQFGWRAPFSLYVILALPIFLLALASIRGGARPTVVAASPGAKGAGSAIRLWPFFLLIFALNVLMTMANTQLPFLLKQEGLASPMVMSVILAGNGLAIGSGALLFAPLVKRLGEYRTLLGALLVAGGGVLIAGLGRTVVVSGAGNILSYLGCGVFLPLTFTMVLNRASSDERGVAIGWINTFTFLGMFANPVVLAPVRALVGLHGVYVLVGLVTIAGAALSAVGLLGRASRNAATPGAVSSEL